jgi:asparagine synthase (glutamine-hydrolysing)
VTALAGLWSFRRSRDAGPFCRKMLTAQKIYGPDDSQMWSEGPLSVGRNLFRTLPEDKFDRQPLTGGDGRYLLVADVRIDNRAELGEALGIEPSSMRSLADADVLLRAWGRWEDEVFDRLLGDYAFALWDGHQRQLILARDPLGMRPLHYHVGSDFMAFASMPKGLHVLPEVPCAPDEVRVAEFVALLPEAGPRSFFAGVSRVEQGHFVRITPSGIEARRHWNPRRETLKPWQGSDAAGAMLEHLDRAVAARLRGAGDRVAAHLSGGLDSAAVATSAARILAGRGGQVVAFTAVPREDYDGPVPPGLIGDEGELAAATAAVHANIEHILVRPEDGGLIEHLDRAYFLNERPMLNVCNQRWWDAINDRASRQHLTVVLTGGMGNASISYGGMELLPELAAQGRWFRLLREAAALVKAKRARWRGVLVAALGPWLPDQFWRAIHRLARVELAGLSDYAAINSASRRGLSLETRAKERGLDFLYRPRKDGLEARLWLLRRVDPGNYYKGILAGWGLDTRDPTADRRLIEFCLSLPMESFLAQGQARALGLKALSERLPSRVLRESSSGYQAIDWHEALTASKDQIRLEIERLERVSSAAATLDLPRMRKLVEDWPSRNWNKPETRTAYRLALLRGVANGHFLRRAAGSNA